MKSFDLVVIGAGSGLDVAVGAAQHGLKTAIINEGPLGGTCLNRGCIPSKMILHSADVAETISTASQFGINATIKSLHPLHAIQRATSLVDHEAKEIEKNINSTKNPVIFKGKASFVNKTTLLINNETITAKKILIAAGTRPSIPPIPGIEKVPFLTSTEALRLQKIPKTMTIIGGGYIAAELGYFFASMGCIITILQRNELLIPTVDIDVARTFTTLWQKKYRVITKADVKSIEKRGDSMIVHYQVSGKKAEIKSDTLLVAAGSVDQNPSEQTLGLVEFRAQLDDFAQLRDRLLELRSGRVHLRALVTEDRVVRSLLDQLAEQVEGAPELASLGRHPRGHEGVHVVRCFLRSGRKRCREENRTGQESCHRGHPNIRTGAGRPPASRGNKARARFIHLNGTRGYPLRFRGSRGERGP